MSHLPPPPPVVSVPALLGMLYAEEKERLDFVYTIYHWWQAIAIFIVYLWSHLPMRVGLCVPLRFHLTGRSSCKLRMGMFSAGISPRR